MNELQLEAQHLSAIELRRRDADLLETEEAQKPLRIQNIHHAANWAVQILKVLAYGASYLHAWPLME